MCRDGAGDVCDDVRHGGDTVGDAGNVDGGGDACCWSW